VYVVPKSYEYWYLIIAFPPLLVGGEKEPLMYLSKLNTFVIFGGSGIVYGIIGELIAGNEFPLAFSAVRYIVYDVPFTNPLIVNINPVLVDIFV
jgi:hypothetical protein